MPDIQLRPTTPSDLEQLYLFQLDKDACYLAAFMAKDHEDKNAYMSKWNRLLNDATVHNRTIWVDGVIAGSIGKFIMDGNVEITYWVDKKYWGRGIGSTALAMFLNIESNRPVYAHVAFNNIGSQKVLEKCGFVKIRSEKGWAHARQMEIEEYIYKLV